MTERWYQEAVIYCLEVGHPSRIRTVTAAVTCKV